MPLKDQVKWIATHAWAAKESDSIPQPRKMSRAEFLKDFSGVLSHFSEVEDARFKVKEATFDEPGNSEAATNGNGPDNNGQELGRAKVAFYLIGRDPEGRREWARGLTNIVAERTGGGRWQLGSFLLASFESMVATSDLFSEVSAPAGVAASRAPYGSPGNSGFVWHGTAASDFDRDGWIDLWVTAPDRNYLYLNDGRGRFKDAAGQAGVAMLASGAAPLALDYDNDGDQDVFISAVGAQVLLENRLAPDGKLAFRDVSLEAGVAVQAIGFSATAGDVNGDGLVDVYVACYNRYGQVTPDSWFRARNGTPNLLFINQGDGTFREEAQKWGVDDRRWSYAATFSDVNGDGRLDLYVVNDFGENGLYINQGDRFIDQAKERGVLDPGNGMGVAFGDYNNDGLLDLHVTNMSSTAGNRILSRLFPNQSPNDNVLKKLAAGNNLYENLGEGRYRDVTHDVGGFSGGWAWGGGFLDFDNDGWEDLFTPNGFISGRTMKDT
jgi:hypothetical protein